MSTDTTCRKPLVLARTAAGAACVAGGLVAGTVLPTQAAAPGVVGLSATTTQDPPVNHPPTAGDDFAETRKNTTVVITVLANDQDPDGDTLEIFSFTQPSNGVVNREGAALEYVPRRSFRGTDSFTYRVSDGRGAVSAVATVTVEVVQRRPR